jgi:hypothetical protein
VIPFSSLHFVKAPTTAIALAAFERLKVGFGHLAEHVPAGRETK